MNVIKDFESVISFVNSVEDNSATSFYMPLSLLPELVANAAYLFDDDFVKAYNADAVSCLDRHSHFGNLSYYADFEEAECGTVAVVASMYVNTEGNTCVRVNDLFQVLEYEGNYYNVYKTSAKRFGMSIFGGVRNVNNISQDKHPNYFSKPTKAVVTRWVEWLSGCEANNIAEIERVKALHAQVRADVAASGLEYHDTREGLSVTAGPVKIYITLNQSGVSYEYRVNYSAIGFGAEAFASLLAKYGKQEQPKEMQEQQKPKAYTVFKALTVENVEGSERWTSDAVKILEAASADSSEVVTDICSRALHGLTRLSDKQRWCVAYAYTRAM